MKPYTALLRIRFIHTLQYRAAALAGMATQFGFGYMFISQYLAFYRSNPSAFPMEVSQIVSYIWIQQAFIALYFTWFFEADIFTAITHGHIAYDLTRPISLYGKWVCQCLAGRLSRAVLRCFPILIVAMALPDPYKLLLPPNALHFALFIVSSLLALGVVITFSMLIYILTFYTMSPVGCRIISAILADFMAGSIVPLPFFPDGFRRIAELLPFAAMQNIPLRIYSGHIAGAHAFYSILFQLAWLVVLGAGGLIWMQKTLKRVIVQGG
jgi:ABC-2 type transport system permease protein